MKKIVLALALILMGGATLSTASAAPAFPVQAGIAAIAQADSNLQLAGGWKHLSTGDGAVTTSITAIMGVARTANASIKATGIPAGTSRRNSAGTTTINIAAGSFTTEVHETILQ